MDFGNHYYMELFSIGPFTVYLTDTLIATWVVMAILIALAVVVRLRVKRFAEVPTKGFQNLIELAVEQIDKLGDSMMGPQLQSFNAYFFGIFAFILLSNYIGLVGLRPPTADLATTLGIGLLMFVLIQVVGIVREKGRYFKSYVEPVALFLPLNLISEISKPISLGFRLFGNILGGLIIMGLVYELLPRLLTFILPDVLHVFFDILIGSLQAFIFTVLSMTFLKQKAALDD